MGKAEFGRIIRRSLWMAMAALGVVYLTIFCAKPIQKTSNTFAQIAQVRERLRTDLTALQREMRTAQAQIKQLEAHQTTPKDQP